MILDEKRRRKPNRENVEAYRPIKKLFHALSMRLRGEKGIDPFSLRADLK